LLAFVSTGCLSTISSVLLPVEPRIPPTTLEILVRLGTWPPEDVVIIATGYLYVTDEVS